MDLVNLTLQGAVGLIYYLTFKGENPDLKSAKIFEAKVLEGIPGINGEELVLEVYLCREKASKGASLFFLLTSSFIHYVICAILQIIFTSVLL